MRLPAPAHSPTARVRSWPDMLAPVRLPGWDGGAEFRLGLLEQEDTAAAAQLLVECFLPSMMDGQGNTAATAAAAATAAEAAAATVPTPPSMPRDMLGLPAFPPLPPLGPTALARWHVSYKGLHWRVGQRLLDPSLDRSLESSLVLAVRDMATDEFVACVELSLRPADGSLPGEFAPPPLLLRHRKAAPLSAYVSNLAVHTGYRRRRLGSQLLTACEEVAVRWRCRDLYLHVSHDNTAARGMYGDRGYQPLPHFDKPRHKGLKNLYHKKTLIAPGPSGDAAEETQQVVVPCEA